MSPISRNTIIVLAAMLLSACATMSIPEYPAEHPANPDAPAAPMAAVTSALDAYRPARAKSGTTQQSVQGRDHEHH